MVLKFLVAAFAFYLFYRAASVLFVAVMGGEKRSGRRKSGGSESRVNVNQHRQYKDQSTKGAGYDGGEYVDFEEVSESDKG